MRLLQESARGLRVLAGGMESGRVRREGAAGSVVTCGGGAAAGGHLPTLPCHSASYACGSGVDQLNATITDGPSRSLRSLYRRPSISLVTAGAVRQHGGHHGRNCRSGTPDWRWAGVRLSHLLLAFECHYCRERKYRAAAAALGGEMWAEHSAWAAGGEVPVFRVACLVCAAGRIPQHYCSVGVDSRDGGMPMRLF